MRCNLCRADVDVASQLAFVKDGIDVVRCPACGLVFRAKAPSLDDLSEIYDAGYFRDDPERPDRKGYADYRADEAAHRRNARRRLGMLSSVRPGAGRLLDVGCAAGFFVSEACRAGWEAEGIDVSEEMVSWGREHVTDNLVSTTFTDYRCPPDSVGAVTMWDYIEHSIDARADLEHARRILAPGGLLAISTGDIESLVARWSGRRWHLLTPRHHNYFFGRTTLARMLSAVGFELVRMAHDNAWYATEHLVYKLEAILPGGIGRAASHSLGRTRLGRSMVPINLFDIVTVVARVPACA